MKYIYIVLCFLVTHVLVYSQSTGYMGKRLQLGYGFHTSPAIMGSNANNESLIGNGGSATTGEFVFNTLHEGFLEFAASSKWMICFSGKYYKTTNDNSKAFNSRGYSGYNTHNIDFSVNNPSGYYTIQGLTYTLYFKYYGARYVAPWGRYVMFGPALNTVTTNYDPKIMTAKATYYNPSGSYYNSYYTDTTISNFGPTTQKFKGLNFMLGYGRTRIIGNRVTVDYGISIHLFSVMSTLFDIGESPFNIIDRQAEINETNYIERTVKYRVRGVNRCNAFFKIGVLLF